ncbi:hypothetical protein ABZS52_30005 [Micromonospora profundi]|uniref:hypothetical protein n=1 Tax=Micromonospora profundi TaxID=1420889 RepID=UPI0033BFA51C
MTKTIIGVATVVLIACFGLPLLLLASVTGGGPGGCAIADPPAIRPSGQPPGPDRSDTEQLDIAATIIDVGVAKASPAEAGSSPSPPPCRNPAYATCLTSATY